MSPTPTPPRAPGAAGGDASIARFGTSVSAALAGNDRTRVSRVEVGFALLDRAALGDLTLGDLAERLREVRPAGLSGLDGCWKMLAGWMDPARRVADVGIPLTDSVLTRGPGTLSPATQAALSLPAFAVALEEGLAYCAARAAGRDGVFTGSLDFVVPVWQASDGYVPDDIGFAAASLGGALGAAALSSGGRLGNRLARSSGRHGPPSSSAGRFPDVGPSRAYISPPHLVLVPRADPAWTPGVVERSLISDVTIRPRRQKLHRVRVTFRDESWADLLTATEESARALVSLLGG